MGQSTFKFEEFHDYSPENFLVAPSNAEAFNYIKNFPWQSYALSIHGPKSSGKTYLSHLAAQHGVAIMEDINSHSDQLQLLHLLNMVKENNGYLLLTSELPLKNIGFTLPDLVSRLSAINSIPIAAPDSELFYLLFARHFSARQLKVSDEVINFLSTRVERNFAAAQKIVAEIDKLSLEEKRNITIPLVKKLTS